MRGRNWLSILLLAPLVAVADGDLPTSFTNQGSIANTRHNLTQSTIGAGATNMNPYRNDYGEVCVYCHTPHGASGVVAAPLWNRTATSATYTTYDALGTSTLTSTVTNPGVNSLTCLSCHDGTLGVDSIINMPGAGNYSAAQETSQNNAFLDTWTNPSGPDATTHLGLDGVNQANGCLACHSPDAGVVGAGATDFTAFAIGTDLRDDHPVGIALPTTRIGIDFNNPTGNVSGTRFYDGNGNGRPDSDEIRFYDTGDGPEVECASCHDPHGVSPGGPGGSFNPTFLRVNNTGSALCLTCHEK
ncbi:MAG: cytochrome c3 family protein [Gammaproteobacteria bacterium]